MIYIGVEKELDLLDYDSLLYNFFKGEHIYVGFSDPFETKAKIICMITPNENSLFKDSLTIDGVEEQKENALAVQISQKIAAAHPTRTLCTTPTDFLAAFPESFLLCHQEKSFLVKEIEDKKEHPSGGLQIIKEITLS